MKRNANSQAGFSLVEISFALLVVAIGMTSVLAMFPEGLRSTRKAVSNTETALFADYLFSTLDLTAGYGSLDGNVKASSLAGDSDDFISLSFSEAARKSGNPHLQIHTGSNKANSFYWMPDFYGVPGSDTMKSSYFSGKLKTAVFTYDLSLKEKKSQNGATIVAVLKVWPGEFDASSKKGFRDEDARIFYREILPPK